MEVKPAKGADLALLVEIYNTSRANIGCYAGTALDPEQFAAVVDGEEVHVAVLEGTIVGFVSVWAAERFIHHLYVAPQHQGRGVGSELLRTCVMIYGVPLSLKCDMCNEHAQSFYRRKGWLPGEEGVGADGPWNRFELLRA
ncbi:MAG TPA: GNAT family N-acetyltransferase [Arenicellales bacterium]|nr:GNAT family N-acetyltransferase [Arenicellales bacterium]